jgi:hypothetical protein
LQLEHNRGKIPAREFVPLDGAVLLHHADIKILAKHALQVAAGKKDRPRSLFSNQGRLFTEMGPMGKNSCPGTNPAKANLPCQPIYPAPARTESAMLKMHNSLSGPLPYQLEIMHAEIVLFFSFSHCVLLVKAIQSGVLNCKET